MILADKIKRQPRSREGNFMENDPDELSVIPESVPAEVSGKTEKNLQEVNVDPSAQTSLGMLLVTYTDSKTPSLDGTDQSSDQTGLKSSSKLSSADIKKSREAESKKDIFDRARKTRHPETRPQEQRMHRLADTEKYPAIAVISEVNTSINPSDTDGLTTSSSSKLNKDMDTKLIKTENTEMSPKQPEQPVAVADDDNDNEVVSPSARSGHRTYIRRDSVDSDDCTLFRGHKIFNYVRPQDRYKADPFYTSRRERLLQRLSMETPVAMGDSRKQVKVAVIFPKHARQRLLQRLVEQNHRPLRTADRGAVHPVLRARIEQFYQTLEPFCLSKRTLE
ncbi:hypothetical protein C0Q70_10914 [Pomacea canaliculata]|uniref:Uncharacterized protein n=1 Tax=Pomacea canaliculata TaxID=400727 RepID=A0A2T7P4H7_POMCA|nr:hypothetical protein C0Q70_10914 [Pomacea canaliculata]